MNFVVYIHKKVFNPKNITIVFNIAMHTIIPCKRYFKCVTVSNYFLGIREAPGVQETAGHNERNDVTDIGS